MLLKNKFWLASLLIGLLLTTACNNDDETEISAIIATWNYASSELDIKINDKPLVTYLVQDLGYSQTEAVTLEIFLKSSVMSEAPFTNSTITFKPDGTFEVKENGTVQDSGTYDLNAAKTILKLTSGNVTDELQVLELNQTRLVIKYTVIENEDLTEDGIPEKVQLDITVRFTK